MIGVKNATPFIRKNAPPGSRTTLTHAPVQSCPNLIEVDPGRRQERASNRKVTQQDCRSSAADCPARRLLAPVGEEASCRACRFGGPAERPCGSLSSYE